MAELLVFIVDKVHPKPDYDALMYKAGDVVEVCEDGQRWGIKELETPFRVVRVPGVPASQFDHLKSDESHLTESYWKRPRMWALRLEQLADTMTEDALAAASYEKTPLPNPRVIGVHDPRIIG